MVRPQPVHRRHAPPVSRRQPLEPELRHRGGQVIADVLLMLEELGGHHGTDRVTAEVFRPGGTAPVPVEPGQRIGATWLKFPAKHITVAHARSIGMPGHAPQGQIPVTP
jgi:hypothetical protein